MLPENVNWNAVLQSITDTWLPLIGMVAAIILVAIIVHVAQKKKSRRTAAYQYVYLKRRLNFQSRRFFVFTQTNDDLQGYGSRLEIILP